MVPEMPKFVLGSRPGSGGFLKVMRAKADDPFTTDNADVSKFLFNSENKLSHIAGMTRWGWSPSKYPFGGDNSWRAYYEPSGSNRNTCHLLVTCEQNTVGNRFMVFYYFPKRQFPDVSSTSPMCEIRSVKLSNGRVKGPFLDYSGSGVNSGTYAEGGLFRSSPGYATFLTQTATARLPSGSVTLDAGSKSLTQITASPFYGTDDTHKIIAVWDLPADSEAMVADGTPVAGQKVFYASPSIIKLARPGYDALTATKRQLILDSQSVTPAKIVRAGEFSLASGASLFLASIFPLGPETYLDFHIGRSGDPVTFPMVTPTDIAKEKNVQMEYLVSPTGVTVYNTGTQAWKMRYMMIAADLSAPTTGGRKILRQGPDYVQIKKNGSSDTAPSLSDIMFDSRMAHVPIVAEGYLTKAMMTEAPTSNYGDRAKTITFPNSGFLPFVKMAITYEDGAIRSPEFNLIKTYGAMGGLSGWNNMANSTSTPALITNTSVKFHMATSHIGYVGASDSGPYSRVYINPVGIRYYIFAIPNNL